MKIIDERIQKQEVLDLSAEMIDMLVEAPGEMGELRTAIAAESLLATARLGDPPGRTHGHSACQVVADRPRKLRRTDSCSASLAR